MATTTIPARTSDEGAAEGPPLPMGRRVDLPGRGTTFFREVEGPAAAPTVVLVHGWLASGGLNWFQTFDRLGADFRVIAPDLRGHGRGLRSRARFRLADCADDIAELLRQLDVGPAIVAGYSMGGPIAQLLWKRHPDLVSGLVFCATASAFTPGMRERFIFTSFMGAAAGGTRVGQQITLPAKIVSKRYLATGVRGARPDSMGRWAAAEMRRHSVRSVFEAGQAIGHYNARKWVGEIDVPTSVLVTTKDRAIKPGDQASLAFAIPGSTIHRLDDGHASCAKETFGPVVYRAVRDVADRIGG